MKEVDAGKGERDSAWGSSAFWKLAQSDLCAAESGHNAQARASGNRTAMSDMTVAVVPRADDG